MEDLGIGFEFALILIATALATVFGAFDDNTFDLFGVRVPGMLVIFCALVLPILARVSGDRLDRHRLRLVGGLVAALFAAVWIAADAASRGQSFGDSVMVTGFLVLGSAEAMLGWWGTRSRSSGDA